MAIRVKKSNLQLANMTIYGVEIRVMVNMPGNLMALKLIKMKVMK